MIITKELTQRVTDEVNKQHPKLSTVEKTAAVQRALLTIADGVATAAKRRADEQAQQIVALEEKIEKLAKLPARGGPVTRAVAVQKQFGGVTSVDQQLRAAGISASLEEIASHATPAQREELAALLLRSDIQNGAHIALSPTRGRVQVLR